MSVNFTIIKPIDEMSSISQKIGLNILDREFANFLDKSFPSHRSNFIYPKIKNLKGGIMFNSEKI